MKITSTLTLHEDDLDVLLRVGERLEAAGYEVTVSAVAVGDVKARRQVVLATSAPYHVLRAARLATTGGGLAAAKKIMTEVGSR